MAVDKNLCVSTYTHVPGNVRYAMDLTHVIEILRMLFHLYVNVLQLLTHVLQLKVEKLVGECYQHYRALANLENG